MKDPTSFKALVQVWQAYSRQLKVMSSMGNHHVATFGANLMPHTNLQTLPSIVHGRQVFQNVCITTTMTPTCASHELGQGEGEEGVMALMNQCFDEMMIDLQQSRAIHNTILEREAPKGLRGRICYSCQEVRHIATRCPQRQEGKMDQCMYHM